MKSLFKTFLFSFFLSGFVVSPTFAGDILDDKVAADPGVLTRPINPNGCVELIPVGKGGLKFNVATLPSDPWIIYKDVLGFTGYVSHSLKAEGNSYHLHSQHGDSVSVWTGGDSGNAQVVLSPATIRQIRETMRASKELAKFADNAALCIDGILVSSHVQGNRIHHASIYMFDRHVVKFGNPSIDWPGVEPRGNNYVDGDSDYTVPAK